MNNHRQCICININKLLAGSSRSFTEHPRAARLLGILLVSGVKKHQGCVLLRVLGVLRVLRVLHVLHVLRVLRVLVCCVC